MSRAIRGFALVATALVAGSPFARPARADGEAPPPAANRGKDAAPAGPESAIDEALALAHLTRSDLGWSAKGYWDRYPQDVPYEMRHVRDLMREPLSTVPWLRGLGREMRDRLSPEGFAKKGDLGAGPLYTLVHDLGVHRRYGAMRPYSANLTAVPTPLEAALLEAWRSAKRSTTLSSFGKKNDWPNLETDLAAAVKGLPADASAVLGKLVLDLLDAQAWVDLAWRRVPMETRVAIHARRDVGIEETDALDYAPSFDDAAHEWDEASLWWGGLKVVEAIDAAREALSPLVGRGGDALAAVHVDVETPRGRVVVNGTRDDSLDLGTEGAFLVVDLGGNDRYAGSIGASSPTRSIGAALDLAGDDVYEGKDVAQGAGSVGVGVLVDAAGNDRYVSTGTFAQGAGLFGLGVLADLGGDDVYSARYGAQGLGWFGVGVLIDAAGKDSYTLWSDGQGFGGVGGGVGVLADGAGDDSYEAVVDAKVTGRPSYHTENKVTVSNAQGCGMGRRGDGSDGHSWAGGVGMLLDGGGNDRYVAANWCQGCGYWFGTGLLWDGGGDDVFDANGWAQGSGAHFCIGCLVDEAGNDVHRVKQNWGPGYGHDFTVGICWDAAGDDRYEAGGGGIGWSINRAVAILFDGGGDDTYSFGGQKDLVPGTAVFDARFLDRDGKTSLYWTVSTSVGLFVDAAGHDGYPAGRSDATSFTDAPGSENARARNFSIFLDRRVPEPAQK